MITMTLEGGKELEAKMTILQTKLQKKINRQAVRKAIKVILTAAQAGARGLSGRGSANKLNDVDMSELIAKSLQIVVGRVKRSGQYYMSVRHSPKYNDVFVHQSAGVARPEGKRGGVPSRRTYIPAAIEYGHTAPNGTFVPPNPYLRPAFDTNTRKAWRILQRELFSNIERAWRVR